MRDRGGQFAHCCQLLAPSELVLHDPQVLIGTAEFLGPLEAAIARLRTATEWVQRESAGNPDEAGAASYDYLRLMGLTAFAHTWARMAAVALPKVEGDNSGFYAGKLLTARFFFKRLLPQSAALLETLTAGAEDLMAMEAEAF